MRVKHKSSFMASDILIHCSDKCYFIFVNLFRERWSSMLLLRWSHRRMVRLSVTLIHFTHNWETRGWSALFLPIQVQRTCPLTLPKRQIMITTKWPGTECHWSDTEEGHSGCARRLECKSEQECLWKLARHLWTLLQWRNKREKTQTPGVCHL